MCEANSSSFKLGIKPRVYSDKIQNNISDEFSRLKGHCYLDHIGSTLYTHKQLENVFSDFSDNIFANPHARSSVAKSTEDAVDIVRYQILQHFNTDPSKYSVIFTSGATAALKTIAECFDFGKNANNSPGILAYLEDNHTSVLGMRCYTENFIKITKEDAFNALSPRHSDSIRNGYSQLPKENMVSVSNLPFHIKQEQITHPEQTTDLSNSQACTPNGTILEDKRKSLFVYPAQSNFSGTKYPLSWLQSVKSGHLNSILDSNYNNWYTVLDCASYVSTNELDLSKDEADFVTISFYKMFGYPTGIGALLVKKSCEDVLVKKYFGGGTVQMALSDDNVMVPRRSLHERFEDGTLPFLSIIAIKHGYDTIRRLNLNFDLISRHTYALAQYVYNNLLHLHHFNGIAAVVLYHDTTFESREHQGGVINFNLLRADGEYVGYSEVLQICNLHGIYLRTGCFCNPGACQWFLKLTSADVRKHFDAGHVCGDQYDLVDGYPTGSVRVSFGYMSTQEDADKFLSVIENCFVTKPIIRRPPDNWQYLIETYKELFFGPKPEKRQNINKPQESCRKFTPTSLNYQGLVPVNPAEPYETSQDVNNLSNNNEEFKYLRASGTLEQIFLYPVKSCGPFTATNIWELTSTGLKYDRQWMIVNATGVCVTQKQNRNLCLIQPVVDLHRQLLILKFKETKECSVPLNSPKQITHDAYICQSKVCGDKIQGWDCGDTVSKWLSENLKMSGLRLLRQCEDFGRSSKNGTQEHLSLANKAHYLLINASSAQWLQSKVPIDGERESLFSTIQRFRPNFVVDFENAFIENDLEQCKIDDILFKFAGNCTRCQMICIDQTTGEISKEPLLTLSKELRGEISFGIYLSQSVDDSHDKCSSVKIGSNVLGY